MATRNTTKKSATTLKDESDARAREIAKTFFPESLIIRKPLNADGEVSAYLFGRR